MAKYVSFFSYSSEAVKGMIDHPSDRTAAAKGLVESLGGTIEAFYWMLGPHDGLVISELPDSVNGAALWQPWGLREQSRTLRLTSYSITTSRPRL